jgi:hypothetical protein
MGNEASMSASVHRLFRAGPVSRFAVLGAILWASGGLGAQPPAPAAAQARITLSSPLDYQVVQRQDRLRGTVRIAGQIDPAEGDVQYCVSGEPLEGELPAAWQPLRVDPQTRAFGADVPLPAGGWYRLEVRAVRGAETLGGAAIGHVGVGEVFVVAGQSNSTNYGAERQRPASGKVASFDGTTWAPADDPQPGVQDGSKGGSFIPAFGDALHAKVRVPIGIASTGAGATSVREWLPKGSRMKQQPTTGANVRAVGPGEWEATGRLFDGLMRRVERLGPRGFRAVLWHQGESDAGQARAGYPADRQITGGQYVQFMETLIRAVRDKAGWEVPWVVAQATYHSEKDAADEEFRAAQKTLWAKGVAFEGPDTDALRAEHRAGVHFNARGQQAHGALWAEKVGAVLDRVVK